MFDDFVQMSIVVRLNNKAFLLNALCGDIPCMNKIWPKCYLSPAVQVLL